MIDNWDSEDKGWKSNIMEGPHGGGRSFSEDWASWSWPVRIAMILGLVVIIAISGTILLWKLS